jgi:hypothetical protein
MLAGHSIDSAEQCSGKGANKGLRKKSILRDRSPLGLKMCAAIHDVLNSFEVIDSEVNSERESEVETNARHLNSYA